MEELRNFANQSGGAVTNVSGVTVTNTGSAQTATVRLQTNRGTIERWFLGQRIDIRYWIQEAVRGLPSVSDFQRQLVSFWHSQTYGPYEPNSSTK
jgi:hypothetical protein